MAAQAGLEPTQCLLQRQVPYQFGYWATPTLVIISFLMPESIPFLNLFYYKVGREVYKPGVKPRSPNISYIVFETVSDIV